MPPLNTLPLITLKNQFFLTFRPFYVYFVSLMARHSYYTAYNTQKLVRLDFQAFLRVFCLAYGAPLILYRL